MTIDEEKSIVFQNHLKSCLTSLFADEKGLIEAVVRDGWPEKMVKKGFELHRRTWNVDHLIEATRRELQAAGNRQSENQNSKNIRTVLPRSAAHIWPAMPGSGVTPVLFGILLGIEQRIRPSRRGLNFARFFCEKTGIELIEGDEWKDADLVIVSGSDETITAVKALAGLNTKVIGYGHRVSFGLVLDPLDADSSQRTLEEWARSFADDIVLWHQSGCFSCRSVLFCGPEERAELFGRMLGKAIEEAETAYDAASFAGDADDANEVLADGLLARRAQAIGLARLRGPVYGNGLGWVQPVGEPFDGRQISPHTISLHSIADVEDIPHRIALPRRHLQGVALAFCDGDPRKERVESILLNLGVTRICAPGLLQSPPADWPHDGEPNILGWLSFASTR